MAYFGGVQTGRPWPKVDLRPIAAAVLAIAVTFSIFTALGGTLLKEPERTGIPLISRGLGDSQSQPRLAAVKSEVVVPKQTVWPGQKLSLGMFTMERRSIEGVEDKVFFDPREIEGSYATSVLVENTPVLREHVNASLQTNPLTSRIPAGHRAVTISVNKESAIEGWARPGVRVDVVWTSQHIGRLIATTIVENALVLSTESSGNARSGNDRSAPARSAVPSHVTLLLTTHDAQKVHLARQSNGALSLSLRGDSDTEATGAGTIALESLLRKQDVEVFDRVQGKVSFEGQEYVLRGQKLVQKFDAKEQPEKKSGKKIIR